MKVRVYNYNNLLDSEINDKVVRVKALMLNSKSEILLGEAFGTVQFPGGHLEENEDPNKGLIREVKEETGININRDYKPFFAIKYYLKDFPVIGNNRSIEIYYYYVFTDKKYNLEKMNIDDQERDGEFRLHYVNLKNFKKFLNGHLDNNPFNKIVAREMTLAMKNWKKWMKENGIKKI